MSERASVFDGNPDFDVSGFAAKKPRSAKSETPPEVIRAAAEAASFRSREPVQKAETKSSKTEPRRYRTGRNTQLNIKVSPETLASFYDIADSQGWVLGETLEKAIASLKRELVDPSSVS